MRNMKILKSLMILLIALCVAMSGIPYNPTVANADESEGTSTTGEEDSEDEDEDDEDDEDEDDIDTVMNFHATSIGKNKVTLKWNKVSDIDGYELTYKKASSSKWTTKLLSKSNTSFKVTKLKVNTKYNFRIRAYVSYLDEDEEDDDEEDYDEIDSSTDTDDSEDEDEEDDEDEDYDDYEYGGYAKMTLRTLKKNGTGKKQAFSNTYEKLASKSIKVPSIKKVQLKSGKATVTWKKSAKAKGYEVYMSKKAKSRFKRVARINKVKTVKYTSKKLKKGKKYYFKVRAFVKTGKQRAYTKYSKTKSKKIK